ERARPAGSSPRARHPFLRAAPPRRRWARRSRRRTSRPESFHVHRPYTRTMSFKEFWDQQAETWTRFARTPGHDAYHIGFNFPASSWSSSRGLSGLLLALHSLRGDLDVLAHAVVADGAHQGHRPRRHPDHELERPRD